MDLIYGDDRDEREQVLECKCSGRLSTGGRDLKVIIIELR